MSLLLGLTSAEVWHPQTTRNFSTASHSSTWWLRYRDFPRKIITAISSYARGQFPPAASLCRSDDFPEALRFPVSARKVATPRSPFVITLSHIMGAKATTPSVMLDRT